MRISDWSSDVCSSDLLSQALRELVIAATTSRSITLHGMGGAGKTTLAMAIATDATVRAAFPHGVLWATLGQESDPVSHLREFAIALGEPALNASSDRKSTRQNSSHYGASSMPYA